MTYSLGTQVPVPGIYSLGPLLFFIAELMAQAYLFRYGYLRRTWWQAGIFLLLIIGVLGMLGRIQHYGWGGLFLTISLLGIPLIYGLYFAISKPVRRRNDWLKLGWFGFNFIGSWLTIFYLRFFSHVFPLFSTIVLFAVFSDFRREEKRAVLPPEQPWDFDKDEPE